MNIKCLLSSVALTALCGVCIVPAQAQDMTAPAASSSDPAPPASQEAAPMETVTPATTAASTPAIQEIVVTGSRLTTSGFSAPTPVTVVGNDFINKRAPSTIGDALSQIPAFRPTTGTTQGTGNTFAPGQAVLDLRGLGSTRTLVLIDGQRPIPTQANGTFDTNMIPVALIDRVDIVTGGASAAYGSDAVAGVVNFVLNDKLQGIKGTMQAGISQRGDNQEFVANLAAGTAFAGGRGHIVFGGDYSQTPGVGNMSTRAWGRREAGIVTLPANRAAGQPATLVADDAHLIVAPGGLITGCVQGGILRQGSACSVGGLTFDDNGQPRTFDFGDPVGALQQVGGEGYNQLRNQYLRVADSRLTGLLRLSYDVTDDITLFAQGNGGRYKVHGQTIDYLNTNIIINRDNPFIPAALGAEMDANGITQLRMNKLNFAQNGGTAVDNTDDIWQAEGGAKGTIFSDWKWDATYTYGVGKTRYVPTGLILVPNYYAAMYVVRDAAGNPVCGPLASNPMLATLPAAQRALVTPGCVPLNPFGTTSESQSAFDYVSPAVSQLTRYQRQTAEVNLSGSPFSTWAGPVSFAIGGEWRKEQVDVTVNALTAARSAVSAFNAANPQPGSGGVNVKEGYIETGIPLAKDKPFLHSLDLNAAGRITDYSSSGTVETWKVGATWEPTTFLRFRATRSRDIRAPNIPELYYRGNDNISTRANPLTGLSNVVNSANLNNPDLKPEKADTFTVGAVLQPDWSWARRFKLSVDYYDIKIRDVIASVPVTDILNRYFLQGQTQYGQYITFDPSAPARFTRVDSPLLNLNSQREKGIDIALSYSTGLDGVHLPGNLSLNILATRLMQLETFDTNGTSLGDLAGSVPKWRGTATLTYNVGAFDVSLIGQYNSSVKYSVSLLGPDDPNYDPAAGNSISDNVFPSALYFNLNADFDVVHNGRKMFTVFGLINNLFDKDPPDAAFALLAGLGSSASSAYDPYDTIGRTFKVGVRFSY